ncbi:MAG: SMC-Scp complex subunit ScpB, partial [Bacteriovoracaceae bacterium]|nr:SMC-Scp complex subunit ScpB [Bacteriovoracaceae bacterium]
GIRLQEVADGYQFRTKATYTKYIRDLFKVSTLQLTPATLEVLAIIAYKQPISKSEIEKMRGVDSSHLVRTLLDKKLVKILGRSEEELGAPTVYATTAEFLDVFNLKNLNDLPPEYDLQDLIQKNVVGDAMSLKEIVGRSKKNKFFFDELDELDEIQKTVKAIATETEFTRTLKEENKKKMSEEEQPTEPRSAFDVMEDFVNKAQAESLEAELNAVQEDMEKLNSAFHAEEEQAIEISSEEANEDWTAEESPFKKSENDATEEKLLN